MSPDPAVTPERAPLRAEDWRSAEEELLARAREVSRRITERVRKVTEDTAVDEDLPGDRTQGHEPVR